MLFAQTPWRSGCPSAVLGAVQLCLTDLVAAGSAGRATCPWATAASTANPRLRYRCFIFPPCMCLSIRLAGHSGDRPCEDVNTSALRANFFARMSVRDKTLDLEIAQHILLREHADLG